MSRVLLIKNANLYDPDPKGIRDILIVDEKVFSVAEHIDPPELSAPVEVVSADGKMVIPGYVTLYQHLEVHDVEDTILTINKVKKAYSPWNSKIYSLREVPNKK